MTVSRIKIPGLADFEKVDTLVSTNHEHGVPFPIIGRNTLFSGYHVIIYDKGKRLKITDEQLT